ncbi:MAG: putative zinc metalloprotease Rip3 [Syntrophaceae bacterium PtaB.Bin038]|nr:MAG: putative zinc metalloprotease Rip3 [Syntrophaceae bacterium PtaB.Bin038]
MFGNRVTLFKLLGFEVRLDSSWIVLAVLITWSLAKGIFPAYYEGMPAANYWAMGVAGAVGLFLSIILHELSHSLVARRFGIPMRGITLFIFGGVAEMSEEPPSAKAEFLTAVIGPVSSLLTAAAFYGLLRAGESAGWPPAVNGVLFYLVWVNVILALFNLLPAFPLDGGRVFRSALWLWKKDLRWATMISSRVGSAFGIVFIALGLWEIIEGNFIGGLWQAMIGLFLRGAARSSYRQVLTRDVLAGLRVSRFMTPDPVVIPPDITLQAFVEEYLYRTHHQIYPVVRAGELAGCLTVRSLRDVPRADWPRRTVGEVAARCDAATVIGPDTDALATLALMNETGNSRLLVVENGRLAGIVTLKDLMEVLALRMEMEGEK